MADRRSGGRQATVARAGLAALALALPLFLSSCVSPSPSAPASSSSGPLVDAGTRPSGEAAPASPAPQPQDGPPQTTASPGPPQPQAEAAPATTPPNDPLPAASTSEGPAPQSPAPSALPPLGKAAPVQAVTAYYVLLDDGGSNGVRFGCNDSLAAVARTGPGAREPLPAAVGALLEAPTEAARPMPAGIYNALSNSDLKFLSGSFDGTTVTVYLAGTLRLGGVCDAPRVEAQLTQTAVAAVGAIRAEIYINGIGLAEALRLD